MDRKKVLIILNKKAGTGKAATRALDISEAFAVKGYEPVIYPIVTKENLVCETLMKEYDGQVDLVLCSGGDGTLNHTVTGLMDMESEPTIAYIPAGSTNDFARSLGISGEFEEALDTALNGMVYRYDLGKMNDTYFNYVAAFGAFSAISYSTDQKLKNVMGHAAYIVNAMSELRDNMHFNCHMKIDTDCGSEEGDYIFGAICNSVSIGGFDMFRDTDVQMDDGKMELLLIKAPANPMELQQILNSLLKGEMDGDNITLKQITEATIISDSNTAWTVDGEFGGKHGRVKINVLQKAVPIMIDENQTEVARVRGILRRTIAAKARS